MPPLTRSNGAPPPPTVSPIVIPFVGASHEHTEPMSTQVILPGAAAVDTAELEVPAAGYMRNILVEVEGAGGVLGAGVPAGDFPFNIFESISLYDVNGAPIYGPIDGYGAFLSNVFGGYAYESDPRQSPLFVEGINPSFHFRIPIEISHSDGMGSISNMSAAAAYKVRMRVRPATQIWTTPPTTPPTLTIRLTLESWTVPDAADRAGRPQAQLPPAHGTSQYWTRQSHSTILGRNTIRLTRTGNMIRGLVLVARDASGVRSDAVLAAAAGDPVRLMWDGRDQFNQPRSSLVRLQHERLNDALRAAAAGAGTPSLVGVYHFSYAHAEKNAIGDGPPALWLPTVQASRLEIDAVSGAAGTWEVYTNDIAPVEDDPAQRYIETSATGLAPEVGSQQMTPAGR